MPYQKPSWGRFVRSGLVLAVASAMSYWQWDAIRDAVVANPVVCVVLSAGAAVLAALLAFGRKVWTILKNKWAQSVADWIDAQARLWGSLILSGFRRRYFKQLLYRHRVFNVRGLRTQGFSLELEKVFVELRVAPQSVAQLSPALLSAEGLTGKRSVWELLVSRHGAFRSLAIIGPPGSGKTTVLRHLALIFAQNKQRRHERRCRAFVPMLLFLRSHAEAVTADDPPTLAELVTDFERKAGLKPPAEWFERKLRQGKALVLFDGLDEIADAEKRRRVINWVAKQIERYGESHFVVTSRPHGYKTNPLLAATVLEVQPFTLEQVERFVVGWYLANEVLSSGKDDAGVRQDAEKQGQDLLQRLRNAPTLAALAVNPLLLTMIAMVHRPRGALPGRRVELYGEICDVLLGHWQAGKGLKAKLTPAQSRAVLQPLAFHLMVGRKREFTAEEAAKNIREPLVEVQGAGADPVEFLEVVKNTSGLVLESEIGLYSFAHLTFQEYLAAAHLLDRRDPTLLPADVKDSWWHETIRLYAAQGDATPIIRACLDAPDVDVLTLAYECLNERGKVVAEVRQVLKRQLIDGLESPDPERRKLAAEVMLELRLRNLLRLNEVLEIDTSYISCAEYQLFINEKLATGEYRQPDHWRETGFAEGAAQQPIAGVRSSDAAEFCDWLTLRSAARGNQNQRFRLPTPEEASDNPVRSSRADDRFDSLRVGHVGTWARAKPPVVVGLAQGVREDALSRARRSAWAHLIAHLRPLARDRDRALTLGLHRDRGLDRVRALSHDLGHARDLNLDFDLNLVRDLNLDRDLGLDRALASGHGLGDLLVRDLARALDRGLDRARTGLDRARDPDLALGLARALDRVFDRALDLDRVRDFAGALDRSLDRALDLARDRDCARGLVLDSDGANRDRIITVCLILAGLNERVEGNLASWEGIRIVREREPT